MNKRDCRYYYEERDMNAVLPFCQKQKPYYPIEYYSCDMCDMYVNKNEPVGKPVEVSVILCKECKHFETHHVVEVNNTPLIINNVCSRWADTFCQTNPNGYCHLAERR